MIFQEVSWIRSNVDKLCPMLRKQALEWYRPFRFVPCFVEKVFKRIRQHFHKISIIVQLDPAQEMTQCMSAVKKISGVKIKFELPVIHSFTARVNAKTLEKLARDGQVRKIWYDGTVKAILDIASPSSKATDVWNSGFTGKDIGIAVIDTGIHPHSDLGSRIIAFHDLVGGKSSPYDDNGHGTHVAGDAASDGSQSNFLYRGSAPSAYLIGVKVLNRLGSGILSTVIQGIQWCIDNKDEYGIRVINLSLGSTAYESYKNDPVCQAVERAWSEGIVVCIAAGNEGPQSRTIASPGIDPLVITVGAIDDNDSLDNSKYQIAFYSSRGPTIDDLNKPDVVCSGTDIISLRSPNSFLDKQNKAARVGNGYITLSGTSMATPICSGIVALLLEADNALTPDQVKQLIMNTAESLTGVSEDSQGTGIVNAKACIEYLFKM